MKSEGQSAEELNRRRLTKRHVIDLNIVAKKKRVNVVNYDSHNLRLGKADSSSAFSGDAVKFIVDDPRRWRTRKANVDAIPKAPDGLALWCGVWR